MNYPSELWTEEEMAEFCGMNSAKEWKEHQRELQIKHIGRFCMIPGDCFLLLKIPTKNNSYGTLKLPDEERNGKLFKDRVARVLTFGDCAFRTKSRWAQGPWFKPGDLITFRSHHLDTFFYNEVNVGVIPDLSPSLKMTPDEEKEYLNMVEMRGFDI